MGDRDLWKIVLVILVLIQGVPAPVPRCSPFIIINKVVEWQNWSSDMNPFFPVPPCEYGGPLQAILAGDLNAVFLLDQPELVPRHNTYEFLWFLKTGYTRLMRMLKKKEKFEYDFNILREGYDHHSERIRTTQFGHGTFRRPEVLNDEHIFTNVAGEAVKEWWIRGQDQVGTNFNAPAELLLPQDRPSKFLYEEPSKHAEAAHAYPEPASDHAHSSDSAALDAIIHEVYKR